MKEAAPVVASSHQPRMDASTLIQSAISQGAPLFNTGDHLGCYNIYRQTATILINAPALPRDIEAKLSGAVEASFGQDPTAKAWTMRHCLDDVLARLRGGSAGGNGGGGGSRTFDFKDATWQIVDDRVMGGSSRSTISATPDGHAVFEGDLVVAGGGFASVRCVPGRMLDLTGARGLRLRCAGDGRVGYKISLKTDRNMDGVSYQASFDAGDGSSDAVKTVSLPLSAFKANFRGRPVPNAPPLRGEDVVQVGVMLSRYDAGSTDSRVQAGRFRLRLVDLSAE